MGQQPETTLVSTVSAGRRARSTTARSDHSSPIARLGNIQLIAASDSGMVITYIDTTRHTYTVMNTAKLFGGSPGSLGMQMQPTVKADSATLDSIGVGEPVLGHATVHFQSHLTMNITVRVIDETIASRVVTVTDYYIAPGVFIPSDTAVAAKAASPVAKMTIPAGFGDAIHSLAAASARMAKIGTVVKSVSHTSMSGDAGSRESMQSVEVLSSRATDAPDSLFEVPPGYTNATPAILRRP